MSLQPPRHLLETRLIEAFAMRPEVYQIHLFGRKVEGKVDRYSDIDVVFCSTDLAATQGAYRTILSQISPIRASWPIVSLPQQLSEMVMLADYSPYQKIDMTIVERIEQQAAFAPFALVHQKQAGPQTSATRLTVQPVANPTAYRLDEMLFSVPRFTKCLFRRAPDMYRRWKGITDVLLELLYERHFGWRTNLERVRLNAGQAKKLYLCLDKDEWAELERVFPPSAHLDLAASYRASLGLFVKLSRIKAAALDTPLDRSFADHMLRFMDQELSRWDRSQ